MGVVGLRWSSGGFPLDEGISATPRSVKPRVSWEGRGFRGWPFEFESKFISDPTNASGIVFRNMTWTSHRTTALIPEDCKAEYLEGQIDSDEFHANAPSERMIPPCKFMISFSHLTPRWTRLWIKPKFSKSGSYHHSLIAFAKIQPLFYAVYAADH